MINDKIHTACMYLVDDSLVVLRREHEVHDGTDHPRLRPRVAPRQQGVQVVLRFQDVVHPAIPRHQPDSDDAPRLHLCFRDTTINKTSEARNTSTCMRQNRSSGHGISIAAGLQAIELGVGHTSGHAQRMTLGCYWALNTMLGALLGMLLGVLLGLILGMLLGMLLVMLLGVLLVRHATDHDATGNATGHAIEMTLCTLLGTSLVMTVGSYWACY